MRRLCKGTLADVAGSTNLQYRRTGGAYTMQRREKDELGLLASERGGEYCSPTNFYSGVHRGDVHEKHISACIAPLRAHSAGKHAQKANSRTLRPVPPLLDAPIDLFLPHRPAKQQKVRSLEPDFG